MVRTPPDLFNVNCPSRDVLALVGSKWAMLILCTLKGGPVRTGDLRRAVGGITQKMLTQTLRELERNGILHRRDFAETPPRVEYSLTDVGRSLSRLVKRMELWVVEHHTYVQGAQARYRKAKA